MSLGSHVSSGAPNFIGATGVIGARGVVGLIGPSGSIILTEPNTFEITVNGFDQSFTINITYIKMGNIVLMNIPKIIIGVIQTSGTINFPINQIPIDIIPNKMNTFVGNVQINGVILGGWIDINTSNDWVFTVVANGNVVVLPMSFKYIIEI